MYSMVFRRRDSRVLRLGRRARGLSVRLWVASMRVRVLGPILVVVMVAFASERASELPLPQPACASEPSSLLLSQSPSFPPVPFWYHYCVGGLGAKPPTPTKLSSHKPAACRLLTKAWRWRRGRRGLRPCQAGLGGAPCQYL